MGHLQAAPLEQTYSFNEFFQIQQFIALLPISYQPISCSLTILKFWKIGNAKFVWMLKTTCKGTRLMRKERKKFQNISQPSKSQSKPQDRNTWATMQCFSSNTNKNIQRGIATSVELDCLSLRKAVALGFDITLQM